MPTEAEQRSRQDQNKKECRDCSVENGDWELICRREKMLVMILTERSGTLEYYDYYV